MATIVVAEDEPLILEIIVELLGEVGHVTLAARDGLAARELLADRPADLLITDTTMPRLDGPSLVRWMRARPELRHVPVVLTSAGTRPALAGLEPVTFVPKPFDLETILNAVARATAIIAPPPADERDA